MSTNIRRSTRRAAAAAIKGGVNAAAAIYTTTTDDDDHHIMMIKNQPEKSTTTPTLSKGERRFPSSDNLLLDQDVRNDSDGTRGRVLRRQNVVSSPTTTDTTHDVTATAAAATRKREATVSPDSSNSNIATAIGKDNIDSNKSKKSRKNVTFDGTTVTASLNVHNSESDTSKQTRTAAQLAREQRSRRREAAQVLDESEHLLSSLSSTTSTSNNKRYNKKKGGTSTLSAITMSNATSHGSTTAGTDSDTTIVRVPMLTGTLILYKGAHRRAVFVRRV